MDTDTATTPGADDVAHVDPESAVVDEASAQTDDQEQLFDGEEGEAHAVEDDLEDVEFEGKTYKLPREVKRGLLREADYTQKTQELAEQRQALAAQREAATQHAEATRALLTEEARVVALNDAVAYYEALNWSALQEQDPAGAQRQWMEYQQAKLRRDNAATALDEKKAELTDKERQQDATRLREVEATLAKDIKGWGPELFRDLVKFAGSYGVTQLDLRQADAASWKILHLAFEGSKTQQQQKTVQRHVQAQKTQPSAPVKGSAPAAGINDTLSTAEWMRRRNAQTRRAG